MAHLKFFPPVLIELQREIVNNHPTLRDNLANHTDTDPELQFAKCLAEIATYCDVALDDTYTPEMILGVCDILLQRLRSKAAPIITTSEGGSFKSSLILPASFNQ